MALNTEEPDSLQLVRAFTNSKEAVFFGVEMIVYSMCFESVMMFVESIIKSFVSVYKYRNNSKKSRSLCNVLITKCLLQSTA